MANIHKLISSYLFSVKENRFCYNEAAPKGPAGAPPAAPPAGLPEGGTETADQKAAREAKEAAEKAAAEARKLAADEAAKKAATKPESAEKQPPKSYEFTYDKEKGEGLFTVTLADGTTKKSLKIKVSDDIKDKIILKKDGVDNSNKPIHGNECIHVTLGATTLWIVYAHKEGKFQDITRGDKPEDAQLKDSDGTSYSISKTPDGNFEIKKIEADKTSEDTDTEDESAEVDLKEKLDVYILQDLLKKEANVDATPEEIKKAFRYYQLDGRERGYTKGKEKKKTEEILDGISKLVKEGKIKPEQLAYIGSVDGTKYLLDKVLRQTQKWHEEKRDALEVLLGFIGNNTVIFEPNNKKPDTTTQYLIKDYILKVGSNLDAAKQLVTGNQDAFLLAQGIFNMALAVQRAKNIKARVFEDKNTRLDPSKDVIRIELGTDKNTDADRKSGLLLLEQNNPVKPFLRDNDIPKDEPEPPAQDSQDKADQPPAGEGEPPATEGEDKPPAEKKQQKKQRKQQAAASAPAPAPAPAPAQQQETAEETWGPITPKTYQDGGFEKGQYLTDSTKFKGIDINNKGIVKTGLWELNKSTGRLVLTKRDAEDRDPTWDECWENIHLRLKDAGLAGIGVNRWLNDYNFKEVFTHTIGLINGIRKAKDNATIEKLGIMINQNWAFSYPFFQGLQTVGGKPKIVIDYWDSPESITKTIDKAVEAYKRSIADKSDKN